MRHSDIVNELSKLDLSCYPYTQATNLIREIDKIGVLVFKMKPGMLVTRARLSVGYETKSDLSYKPQHLNTTYQRASTPYRTMFYGTIVYDTRDFIDSRAVAIAECSNLAREGIESKGIEKFTFGRWKVIQDIELIAIVPLNIYTCVKYNPLLDELRKVYRRFISLDKRNSNNFQLLSEFFSQEFGKEDIVNDYDYLISAVFSEIITNDFNYDGILYPSVRMGGEYGYNVAIKPEAVDKKLVLDVIGESTYYKNKGNSISLIEKTFLWDNEHNVRTQVPTKKTPIDFVYSELGIISLDQLQ